MSTERLFAYLKKVGRFMIAEHDDAWWMTDQYLLVRFDGLSPITKLLDDYNLDLKPTWFSVDHTIRPNDNKLALVGKLIDEVAQADLEPMDRWKLRGNPILLDVTNGPHEVWETAAGRRVALDSEKRRMVDDLVRFGTWCMGPAERKPTVKLHNGSVVALLMPVLMYLDDEAEAS